MRKLYMQEVRRRGCHYCLDSRRSRSIRDLPGTSNLNCIHDKCPYYELNKFKNYSEYLKSEESKSPIEVIIPRLKKKLRKKL